MDCYLLEEIAMNIDANWDSFYLYKDAGGKLVFGPMWDFDLAFGNDCRISEDADTSHEGFYVGRAMGSNNGWEGIWYVAALENQWFREMVLQAWNENYDTFTSLGDRVRELALTGQDACDRNFERWQILGNMINMEPSYIQAFTSFSEHAQYLATWLDRRVAWLNEYYNDASFVETYSLW